MPRAPWARSTLVLKPRDYGVRGTIDDKRFRRIGDVDDCCINHFMAGGYGLHMGWRNPNGLTSSLLELNKFGQVALLYLAEG